MKIGILKCGTVPPDLFRQYGDYHDMFIRLFGELLPDAEFLVYDVTRKEYPGSLDEVDAFLSTGSKFSVYDKIPWILSFRDFVKDLYVKGKKFIGICFGHQMIAHSLGGCTEKSSQGWGLGIKAVDISKKMPWMIPPLFRYNLIVTHQDQVVVLPPGAELLGTNTYCPYSLYQVGENFLSMQAHPEFTADFVKALLPSLKENIGIGTYNSGLLTLENEFNQKEIIQWMAAFLKT